MSTLHSDLVVVPAAQRTHLSRARGSLAALLCSIDKAFMLGLWVQNRPEPIEMRTPKALLCDAPSWRFGPARTVGASAVLANGVRVTGLVRAQTTSKAGRSMMLTQENLPVSVPRVDPAALQTLMCRAGLRSRS